MKKIIMIIMAFAAIGFLAGCTSISKHYNMTGTWKYTLEETGRNEVQNGSMTIIQEAFRLRGTANDAFGEFALSGTIAENGLSFAIDGRKNTGKREFHLSGILENADTFEGTFTTDQNTSGKMKGTRITAE